MVIDIKYYDNIMIVDQDYEVLKSLDKMIQKQIPFKNYRIPIKQSDQYELGFHADKGKIDFLVIFDTKFRSFPSSVFELQNLKAVLFSREKEELDNIIFEIPKEISKLHKLKYLNLRHNGLKQIPESLFNIHSLEYLLLSVNDLSKISEKIKSLTNLKSLDLRGNELNEFPDSILHMKNLVSLDLGINNIESIPAEIENLISLKYLDLSDNPIKTIPDEIGNLKSLEYLTMDDILTLEFPKTILKLTNLKSLSAVILDRQVLPEHVKNMFKKLKEKGVNIHGYIV